MDRASRASVDEQMELRISKFHLQLMGGIFTIMLGLLSYFLYDAADGIKQLTTSVGEFSTYIKTNDLQRDQLRREIIELQQDQREADTERKDLEKRVLILEQRN